MIYLWIGTIYRGNEVVMGEKGLEGLKRDKPQVSRARLPRFITRYIT